MQKYLYVIFSVSKISIETLLFALFIKGCCSFDLCKHLNLLATGSSDHKVRIWNPYVPQKPIAILFGHNASVLAVKIHSPLLALISYSLDAVCFSCSKFSSLLITNMKSEASPVCRNIWNVPPPPEIGKIVVEIWCYLPEVYTLGEESEIQ